MVIHMKNCRIGVIGAGAVGKIHIHNLVTEFPQVSVAAVVDADETGTKAWLANQYLDIPVVGDIDSIINDPSIDAVLICSPSDTHAEYITKSAAAGKHIFCEKPVDYDVVTAQRAVDAVTNAGVILQMGFHRRFDRNHKKVRDMVRTGEIGQVHLVHISSRSPWTPAPQYFKDPDKGGIFFDTATHDFDMLRYLTGDEVAEIFVLSGHLGQWKFECDADDTAIYSLRMKNGALATIENSWHANFGHDQRLEVQGVKGTLESCNVTEDTVRLSNSECVKTAKPFDYFKDRYAEAYRYEIECFLNSIDQNIVPLVTGQDGVESLLLCTAAREAKRSGLAVKLDDLRDRLGLKH